MIDQVVIIEWWIAQGTSLGVFLSDWFWSQLEGFVDLSQRSSVFYLLSAVSIALVWAMYRQDKQAITSFYSLFSPRIWWSLSAQADYKLWLVNSLLMLAIAPLLLSQLTLAYWLFEQLHLLFSNRPDSTVWPSWLIVTSFTLCHFLLDDFARFYLHRLLHKVPFLWAFHKVHHSARSLTPFTVFRTHPIEALLFTLRSVLVQATSLAIFVFAFGSQADLYTVLGVSVFSFVFNLTGANLRHSRVPLGYWRILESVLMSPAQHQLHHSVEARHFDKNFGVVLSIWDKIWGCHCYSEKHQQIQFGLTKQTVENEHKLTHLYGMPFVEAFQVLLRFKKFKRSSPLNKAK